MGNFNFHCWTESSHFYNLCHKNKLFSAFLQTMNMNSVKLFKHALALVPCIRISQFLSSSSLSFVAVILMNWVILSVTSVCIPRGYHFSPFFSLLPFFLLPRLLILYLAAVVHRLPVIFSASIPSFYSEFIIIIMLSGPIHFLILQ